jgi:hypothetical protein
MGSTAPLDWSLDASARNLLVAQIVPLAVSVLLYFFVRYEFIQLFCWKSFRLTFSFPVASF